MNKSNHWIATSFAVACWAMVQQEVPTLKDAFKGDFYIGAALNESQFMGNDAKAQSLIRQQFNSISPENALKWASLHPQPDSYNFGPADQYVAFGQQNKLFTIGHTLVWHNQTPKWVFEDASGQPASREVLLRRMEDHITTVVSRYKGKIQGWDVVNEALNEDGTLRQSKWLSIIGDDFILKAFEFAHKADPQAELYYNDYNLWKPEKRAGAIRLINSLRDKGIPVKAVGEQGHYSLRGPASEQIEASIDAFAKAGIEVNITELDVDVLPTKSRRIGADVADNAVYEAQYSPYATSLPDSLQQKFDRRYADLFALFHRHRDHISRVTFWGLTDRNSWLNNWPMKGRTNYPLLFDHDYQPKPAAFQAVVRTAQAK